MAEIRMIFHETIDILSLAYQFFKKIKEYLKFINDREQSLNLFYFSRSYDKVNSEDDEQPST